MNKHIIFFILICCLSQILWSQPANNRFRDEGFSLKVDDNDNVYISGYTKSLGNGNRNAYIAKFDNSGNFIKEVFWGKNETDEFRDIILKDNNIYATGISYWRGGNSIEMIFALYNSELELQWITNFGGLAWQYGYFIETLSNGSILFGGMDRECGLGRPLIVKTNDVGDVYWVKNMGECSSLYPVDVMESTSGNLTFLCSLGGFFNYGTLWSSASIHDADILLLNTDFDGNVLHIDTIGGNQHDIPVKLEYVTPDKSLLLAHSQSWTENKNFDICLFFLNGDNTIDDVKTFGGNSFEYAADMDIDADGNIHIIGTNASYTQHPVIYYLKLDQQGNIIDEKYLLTEIKGYGASIEVKDTSIYILANLFPEDDFGKMVLMKNFEPCDTFDSENIQPIVEIYPNPVSGQCRIDTYGMFDDDNNIKINIYGIKGTLVKTFTYYGNYNVMDLSDVASGHYIVVINGDKRRITKKIIVKNE
ncbi:MAG: T9SS type A sorting domain-containing protein [Bacteroidales bacterium]